MLAYNSGLPDFDAGTDTEYRANPGTFPVFLRLGRVEWEDGETR